MPETSPSQQYRGSNDTNVLVDDSQYHDSYPKPQPQPQPGWPEGAKEHMWTPIWLTKSVLLIFAAWFARSEEHTSELQSLMRNSYAVFCLKKKKKTRKHT